MPSGTLHEYADQRINFLSGHSHWLPFSAFTSNDLNVLCIPWTNIEVCSYLRIVIGNLSSFYSQEKTRKNFITGYMCIYVDHLKQIK